MSWIMRFALPVYKCEVEPEKSSIERSFGIMPFSYIDNPHIRSGLFKYLIIAHGSADHRESSSRSTAVAMQ
jgi:hypothetical protein